MRQTLVITLVLLIGLSMPTRAQTAEEPPRYRLPLKYEESVNPDEQQYKIYEFMWRSFVALNWPNVPIEITIKNGRRVIDSGYRGQPDSSKKINYTPPGSDILPLRVWETYKEPYEIFLEPDQWADYPKWNTPRQPPPDGPTSDTGARRLLRYPVGLTEYTTDVNQPYFFPSVTGPLIDQNGHYVRYEVAVNQAFFTYVRTFYYYNAVTQIFAVDNWIKGFGNAFRRPPFGNPAELGPNGYLQDLPPWARQGMVDVKAAWKVLDEDRDDRTRYLNRRIVDAKGTTRLMGLVALHILRYTPNDYDEAKKIDGKFVAATFEQVDNVSVEPNSGLKPSFNNGSAPDSEECAFGFNGEIPPPPPPEGEIPPPVDIYRVASLPVMVQKINKVFQEDLFESVFRYYQLIGTQNKYLGTEEFKSTECPTRHPLKRTVGGHEGPVTGIYTNTNNLINAALESYSQTNFSCILCHVRARPIGVPDKAFEIDHFKILTFLLQSAKCPSGKKPVGGKCS